jgi:hypothetical protein
MKLVFSQMPYCPVMETEIDDVFENKVLKRKFGSKME